MEKIFSHLKGLRGCSFFAAKPTTLTPALIPEGREYVEVLTAGKILWEENGETKVYERGTIFWHKAGEYTIYRFPKKEPYRCGVWHFEVTSPERLVPRIGFWSNTIDLDIFMNDCIESFHSENVDNDIIAQYSYGVLMRQMFNQNSKISTYPPLLVKAINFMESNLSSSLSVEFIATKCGLSAGHLFLLFKKHMEISPHQYILERQLARARSLLVSEDWAIKEISQKCGFENLEVFYRQFSKVCSIPPGEYRRRNQFSILKPYKKS